MEKAFSVMETMGLEALNVSLSLLPIIDEEAKLLQYASHQGVAFAPNKDYVKTALVANAANTYLEGVAYSHGIASLAQDNNLRVMEICLLLGLEVVSGRTGNDLVDSAGNEFELKTCSLESKSPSFGSSHHLNHDVIEKYRKASFIFATYFKGRLICIYVVHSNVLAEKYFDAWSVELTEKRNHLNNPKFSIDFVRKHGVLLYGPGLNADWKKRYSARTAALGRIVGDAAHSQALNCLGRCLSRSLVNWADQIIASTARIRLKALAAAALLTAREERRAKSQAREAKKLADAARQLPLQLEPAVLEGEIDAGNLVDKPDAVVSHVELEAVLQHPSRVD